MLVFGYNTRWAQNKNKPLCNDNLQPRHCNCLWHFIVGVCTEWGCPHLLPDRPWGDSRVLPGVQLQSITILLSGTLSTCDQVSSRGGNVLSCSSCHRERGIRPTLPCTSRMTWDKFPLKAAQWVFYHFVLICGAGKIGVALTWIIMSNKWPKGAKGLCVTHNAY